MDDVLEVIVNGLTYAGQPIHIVINYTLIVLVVVPFLLSANRAVGKKSRAWLACLTIAVIAQVALWFAARGAIGVSLVWSIMLGYLLIDYLRGNLGRTGHGRRLVPIALGAGCGGIVYYAVGFPAITTIAHLVAAGIGVGFWSDRSELDARVGPATLFEPTMSEDERELRYHTWLRAVERSRGWADAPQ